MGLLALTLALVLSAGGNVPQNYFDSIRHWQKQRDERLRADDSWLTLAGLFWLKPGDNTIGSADSNDFVLPKGAAPAEIGRLRLEGKDIVFTNLGGAAVTLNNHPVTSEIKLNYLDEDKPDIVRAGSISFFIIKRVGRLGIRAKDTNSPVRKNFDGLKYFPINPAFRFEARFTPEPKRIPILNIVGQTDMEESPGVVEFTYQGQEYRLRPIYEGKTLFFLFKDPTNRSQTYPAGRMLNTPLPAGGKVDLDFNKSYNPPCAFTPYATCPLPPKQNTLPIPIEAGELRYEKGRVE